MQDRTSAAMTCVGRYMGNRLRLEGTSIQYVVYRNGTEDTLYVTANWYPGSTSVPGDIKQLLGCTLNGTLYSFTTLADWTDPVCVLPYVAPSVTDENDPVTPLYALVPKNRATMIYNSDTLSRYVFSVGDYSTQPQMTFTPPTLYGSYSHRLRWTLTSGDGRNGWVTALALRIRTPGAATETETALFTDALHMSYNLKTDSTIVGKEVCIVLEYRTYPVTWDGDDLEEFVTLNRYVTPWQTVSRDAATPLAPTGLVTSLLLAGGRVTVRWDAVADPLNSISGYQLERSVNGGTYTSLYSGTSTQFRDTLPTAATSVAYRVCAVNSKKATSPWTDSGALAVAQSNLYVAKDGKWVRAAGVWSGDQRASPMLQVGGR